MALVATAVAVGHAAWIITHRRLGALDPDEAGYIASAMRFQRSIDPAQPLEFIRTVLSGGNGPFVPLLGVPLLIAGPRNPLTVMMVQPILLVVTCVAIAGTTRKMTGPLASFGAGCAFLAMPTASLATQSFWLGMGATASISVAAWALVSSDRLTNRLTLLYGFAMAAMLLSRTMTVAFLPGMVLAGAVVAGRQRKSWRGLAMAAAVAVLVAGPWYLLQREAIFGYLVDYGYGERAGLFGSGGPLDRFDFRFDRIAGDIGRSITWTALIIAATTIPVIVWRWRTKGTRPQGARIFAALSVAVACGFLALVSTTNNGVWFELPLISLLIPAFAALTARAVWPLRAAMVIQLVGQAAIVLAVTWWLVPPAIGITAHYEHGFAQYDERYEEGRRDEQREAAADWRDLSSDVASHLRDIDGGSGSGAVFMVSGNMQLFNSNTISLAAETNGWGPSIRIPDTTTGAESRAVDLTPTTGGRDGREAERVLIIAEHDRILFTPDADVDLYLRQARDAGWREEVTFPMPSDGQVHVLRHPENPPAQRSQDSGG